MESSRYYAVTLHHGDRLTVDRSYGIREYAQELADQWQARYEENGMASNGVRAVVLTQEQMDAYKTAGMIGLGEVL